VNPTIADLLQIIGQQHVEIIMLRQQLGQLEQAGKKKPGPLKAVKNKPVSDGNLQS